MTRSGGAGADGGKPSGFGAIVRGNRKSTNKQMSVNEIRCINEFGLRRNKKSTGRKLSPEMQDRLREARRGDRRSGM